MLPLTLLVLSLPAQASLADHLPRGVHLVEATLLAQAEPPPLLGADLAPPVSLKQLQADYDALRRSRPSFGGPITMLGLGGGGSLLGVTYLVVSTSMGLFSGTTVFLVLGIAFLAVGLPLGIIGAWLLYHRIADRVRLEQEMKALQAQMQELRQTPAQELPPPPPLQVEGPAPRLLLARF